MMPDTYDSAIVLIGAGLSGLVVLWSFIALARAVMSRKPRVVCLIEDQPTAEEWGAVARGASEGVSRVLVLVECAPEKRYPALTVVLSATTELGPHALAAIAEPNDLVVLHDFCRRN